MGMPLKVSDDLFAAAKQEAAAENRSITAQVEHWARIGRGVEAVLAHGELLGIKKAAAVLGPAFPQADRRREVHDLLMRVAESSDRGRVTKAIRSSGTALYEADPSDSRLVVQALPDGTRTRGRIEGRRFIAAEDRPVKKGTQRKR
jgi:hypothetical protein